MTEDPIRDSLNWYAYCGGNPINFIDPFGLAALRAYVEGLGGTIDFWDDKTKTATATLNGITRSFTAGTYGIFIDANWRMDVPDDILFVAFTKASQVIVNNKGNITSSGSSFGVNPQVLASAIFTEQHYNVNWEDYATDYWGGLFGLDTSIGVAQVKISTAMFVEDKGYMPLTLAIDMLYAPMPDYISREYQMIHKLLNNATNINYAAAYLRYFQDTWVGAYPNIANDPGILGTLYNRGHQTTSPNSSPGTNWFGNYVNQHYNAMGYLLGL